MEFANDYLEKVVQVAKDMGLTVWTFEKQYGKIEQVFFDDGKTYGTASVDCGIVKFGTCHRPCKCNGAGFGMGAFDNMEEGIKASFAFAPHWASNCNDVVKQTFEQHMKKSTLKYYKL